MLWEEGNWVQNNREDDVGGDTAHGTHQPDGLKSSADLTNILIRPNKRPIRIKGIGQAFSSKACSLAHHTPHQFQLQGKRRLRHPLVFESFQPYRVAPPTRPAPTPTQPT